MVGQGIRKQVKEIYKRGPGRMRDSSENVGWVSLGHMAIKNPQDSPALSTDHVLAVHGTTQPQYRGRTEVLPNLCRELRFCLFV